MGRGDDPVPPRPRPDFAPPAASAPPTAASLVADDEVEEIARRVSLATAVRFLVLLVAAFVIGVLIWMVADEVAAPDGVQAIEFRGAG